MAIGDELLSNIGRLATLNRSTRPETASKICNPAQNSLKYRAGIGFFMFLFRQIEQQNKCLLKEKKEREGGKGVCV